MTRALQVTWFIPVDHRNFNAMPASIWIRCLQMIPYLEKMGVRCTVNDPEADADVCVFVRWQDDTAYALAEKMKRRGIPVIFDLCVNYFKETGLFSEGYGSTRERVLEAARFIDLADAITCASRFIAAEAAVRHPRVYFLPDSVDSRHFNGTKNPEDFLKESLTAVWAGVSVKAGDLSPVIPLLEKRGILLTVISDRRPELAGAFRFIRWTYETFPESILSGDICISPRRTDNSYDLGHSFFKIGVFLAQGIPAIASPVPSYQELLVGNDCGRVCGSPEEWARTLDFVMDDRPAVSGWSGVARNRMQNFLSESVSGEYVRVLSEVALCKSVETAAPG